MGLAELQRIALFFLSLAAVSSIVGVAVYGNTAAGALRAPCPLDADSVMFYLQKSVTVF